jgi:hypothetical protein
VTVVVRVNKKKKEKEKGGEKRTMGNKERIEITEREMRGKRAEAGRWGQGEEG